MGQNRQALLAVAAEMRSGGSSWDSVGKKVRRKARTCAQWPRRFRRDWLPLFAAAQRSRCEAAGSDALGYLRMHMRSEDAKVSLRAVELALRYGLPDDLLAGTAAAAYEPEPTEWDRGLANSKAIAESRKKQMDRLRAKEGLPPLTDGEFYRKWDEELEAASNPKPEPVYFDENGTVLDGPPGSEDEDDDDATPLASDSRGADATALGRDAASRGFFVMGVLLLAMALALFAYRGETNRAQAYAAPARVSAAPAEGFTLSAEGAGSFPCPATRLPDKLLSSHPTRPLSVDRVPATHSERRDMTLPRFFVPTAALLALCTGIADAQEKLPPNTKIVKVEARPASFDLKTPFDYRQLLVDATLDTGDVIDVTRLATFQAPAGLKASPAGQVRPVADGKSELIVSAGGQTARVPVNVSGQKDVYPVSFVRDVMPMLSKLGCNAGTCHGSAEGKNGFKLSLRGYDPIFDHRALTDDLESRRFNRAAPERSLMLMKPAGAVPHAGGVVWQPGDPSYEEVKMWIAQGVKYDGNAPRVTSIEVLPKERLVSLIGQRQQLVVMATYADGSKRDVSAEAFIDSSNTEVATVDKNGLVTTVRRGEATMLARYEGAYAASTLVVMGDRSGFQWTNPETFNWVDELVYEKLKKVKVQPSELCTDTDFIRRIYIDLTGLPPEPAEVRAFIADSRPTRVKRDELIDKLIGGEAFIEHWTNKWADMLQVNRKFLGDVGAKTLREYIRKAVVDNMPYDKFAYEVLTASGSNAVNGPAAYFKTLRAPDTAMENTTHLFLAIRFNCNKCHDHPFERWTQDQYYNLASYFAQVGRARDPKYPGNIGGSAVEGALPLVEIISDTNSGEVKHDRTGETVKPKFPFEHKDRAPATAPRRVQLAKWITSKENPYFAKSYVNRMWSYLLGVGIIEPVDDIRAGNPPTNPALLDRLTKEFMDSNFDVRKVMKTICKSRTYQLSIKTNKWNDGDEINYSHAQARRLSAEALFDAIHRTTGSTSKIPGLPPGARAAQVLDGSVDLPSGFLDLFGKPVRESACECERSSTLMLGPVLNLVNGPIVADAIRDPNNRLAKLAATVKDDAKFVEEIYLAVLSRLPTPTELKLGLQALKDAEGDFQEVVVEHKKKLEALQAYEMQLDAKQPDWEKKLATAPKWEALNPDPKRAFAKNRKGTTINVGKDGTLFVTGDNPTPEAYTVEATTKLKTITAIRLEVLTDDKLPAKGPGRAPNGNFVLHEFKVTATPAGGTAGKPVALHKAKATFSQDQFAIAGAIDGNPATGWAIAGGTGKPQSALFELKEPISAEAGTKLTVVMDQLFAGREHNIGKFRLLVTGDAVPRLSDALPADVAEVVATPAEKRTPEQQVKLSQLYRNQDAEYKRLQGVLAATPLPADHRVLGGQDLMWALINSPAFLFNH